MTPANSRLSRFILHRELKLISWTWAGPGKSRCEAIKSSTHEVCPRCATKSSSIYDHRFVTIKDAPIRGTLVELIIKKRRFYCYSCRKPFTEPIAGIWPKRRTTERYRRTVLWACENFSDLKRVTKAYRCSSALLYKILYEQLELRLRSRLSYPWPKTIGIDEIYFRRGKHGPQFVTVIVDYNNRRVLEVIHSRLKKEIIDVLQRRPGRENVKNVIIDMSGPYRSVAREFFPNALITADKFHVLKLLTPAINRHRKAITGDARTNPIRKLLLMNRMRLDYYKREALDKWLTDHPNLRQIYEAKEALFKLYRCKGDKWAFKSLKRLLDALALSPIPELQTLRKTLMNWKDEILNYFVTRLTNGRTEGFNNMISLVKRRAFGYRTFRNFRLRLLNACL